MPATSRWTYSVVRPSRLNSPQTGWSSERYRNFFAHEDDRGDIEEDAVDVHVERRRRLVVGRALSFPSVLDGTVHVMSPLSSTHSVTRLCRVVIECQAPIPRVGVLVTVTVLSLGFSFTTDKPQQLARRRDKKKCVS